MYMYRISIACTILIVLTILRQIHNIQLNSYNLDQQVIWYKKNIGSFAINIVLLVSAFLYYELKFIYSFFFVVIALFGLLIENLPRKQKKKLIFTPRIKRLISLCIIFFVMFYIPLVLTKDVSTLKYIVYAVGLSPLIIFLAYYFSLPMENAIRKRFMLEANVIINSHDNLYTIGVTGSFGKTSVKYYLSRLLKLKYSVCFTPESYNTAMGATLTIKNDLKNINDIFICEMGARRIGDVKEICDIVNPSGAIITDVGNMHLDTFKDIENVKKCKFELVDAVYKKFISDKNNPNEPFEIKVDIRTNKENVVLLNGDNELIREKAKEYSGLKIFFYGFNQDNDFTVKNIELSNEGTHFVFVDKCINVGEEIELTTKLLGRFNIMNLLAAVSYARLLDVDTFYIKNEVKSILPVSHRLELLTSDKYNLIIDDAYNANPNGARNASDVIGSFDGYTKIIITPGMVELSDKQDEENEKFASYAGEKVDYAFVVGKTNRSSLNKGFETKLKKENIINFDKVEEAIFYARNEISGKKVILLENDLSDNY